MAEDKGQENGTNVVVFPDDELDRKVLDLRLAGLSIRRLSKEFKISERAVLASLDRSLPPLTNEMRSRLFREDLSRLDELLLHWYVQARNGSVNATQPVMRIMERRAALAGLDTPLTARVAIDIVQQGDQPQSSTTALLEQLNRICAERPDDGHGLTVIEGELAEPDPAPPAA